MLHDVVTAIHEARQARPVDLERLAQMVGLARMLRDFFGLRPAVQAAGGEAAAGATIEFGEESTELQLVALLADVCNRARAKGVEEVITGIDADHHAGLSFTPATLANVARVADHNFQKDVTGQATVGTGTVLVGYGHDEAADELSFGPFPVSVVAPGAGLKSNP